MAGIEDDTESLSDRQENELQVLQAIYMDDVKDLRDNDAWKIKRPPEIQISLGPQESFNTQEAHVSVVLNVKCPPKYPEIVPHIHLENHKGLSTQQLNVLTEELRDMCKKLIGEVMILDLCQYIQKFLHAHNNPPSLSFYDEMMTNRKMLEERTARETEHKLEMIRQKQAAAIEEEIQKRQEALREEARKRRQLARQNSDARYSTSSDPSTPGVSVSDPLYSITPIPKDLASRQRAGTSPEHHGLLYAQPSGTEGNLYNPERRRSRRRRTSTPLSGDSESHDHGDCSSKTGIVTVEFNMKRERKVLMGKCLGSSRRGSCIYAAMDTHTGELVTVSEWVLKWRHINRRLNMDQREMDEKEANKYMKQIASLEKETFALLRLSHKNLVHYHAFKYTQDSGKITLHLLMDHVGGGNLSAPLRHKEPVQMDQLRSYCCQLLEALAYLHNKAVVHKDLRPSSLLLDSEGKLRLGDISLTKRLVELVKEVNTNNNNGVKFEEEDEVPTIGGRGGKKADIYRFGLVMLSLAQGHQVTDKLPSIPTSLPQEFQDFLSKCLIKDEYHRWSAHQLLDHDFVKTPICTQPVNMSNGKTAHNMNHLDQESDDDSSEERVVIPFIPACDSGSRLQNEFEILKWIGKGGFGDVIKVKNKLDGRYYAIKRIPLNPTKKAFTKKITREVKLLSMLNHENVVRYYNSWIETSSEPATNDDSTSSFQTSSSLSKTSLQSRKKTIQTTLVEKDNGPKVDAFSNCLRIGDDWEKNVPGLVEDSLEWSVSVDITRHLNQDDSDDDDDDDSVFGTSILPHSDDSDEDGIIFEHNSNSNDEGDSDSQERKVTQISIQAKSEDDTDGSTIIPRIQFLYIQMEFCEKSTLRNCIDAGLYEDVDRVWRLFREIVEGLVHIHQQGMIHRDLKPVNIFLDSNDHVKIGDFGLATTDIISKQHTSLIDLTLNPGRDISVTSSRSESHSLDDGGLTDMTGKVGTALYVAPEMTTTSKRVHYSQKVDIYSLGVMFFEMCHHPLPTGMERVQILSRLREPEVELPDDFDQEKLAHQAALLHLLLSHDPSRRPTACEILQSEHMPPPQMEEAELNEVLRSTIANPDSKLYKRMIDAIFSQPITPAMDFAYDNELYRMSALSPAQALITGCVTETLERIFKRHGAIKMSMPLLMPKSALYEGNESYVCFMDHIGGLVALPYDLKSPFARFVARYDITELKRYTIEKVYRENRVYGLHPKELIACSFDIVTPTSAGFVPDAEVISVVFEAITEFPVLQSRPYYLRINHACLLKGILLYCGVPENLHQEVYAILGDTKSERQKKQQIQTRLYSLSLTEHSVETLYTFVETEGPYGKVASMLRRITKTRGTASTLATRGLKEMEAIINHTEALGHKVQAVLTLGLISNVKHFSGAIFQVVRNIHRKNRPTTEVLAAGGRYDTLVATFRKPGCTPLHQCVVGISVAVDRIMAAAAEQQELLQVPSPCDAVICSLGSHAPVKEKLAVAKDLWAAGICTDIVLDANMSLEDVQERCRKNGVSHIVILKDTEIKLRSLDRDKVQEKKLKIQELPSYLQLKIQVSTQEQTDQSLSQSSKSSVLSNQLSGDSVMTRETRDGGGSSRHQFNITFIHQDINNKIGKNARRNYESQIYSNVSSCLTSISTRCQIEIVAVDLTAQVLKTMAAFLDFGDDDKAFSDSIGPIVERHPRHRKYLTKVFDHISEIKFEKNIPVILLYGLKDDSYRVLL